MITASLNVIRLCLKMSLSGNSAVQKFVEHVHRLVSVRWEFSLRGIIELTKDLKCGYCLVYPFLLTILN